MEETATIRAWDHFKGFNKQLTIKIIFQPCELWIEKVINNTKLEKTKTYDGNDGKTLDLINNSNLTVSEKELTTLFFD